MISPKLGWQRWYDPFSVETEEDDIEKNNDNEFGNNVFDENTDSDICEGSFSQSYKKAMKVIITPMGALPIPEHSTPQKVFNLWTAHTNFSITKKILDLVEKIDGVETVDVFTRYRMRIGIGKMFGTQDVISRINKTLIDSIIKTEQNGSSPIKV